MWHGAPATTKDITAAEVRLLHIMRECQFGRIENMPVSAGQPVFNSDVKVVRAARLGGDGPVTKLVAGDQFELKRPVRDLFDALARLGNGMVVRLEFRHGLPSLLETEAPLEVDALG
jgi:hypothetical protein